MLTRPLRPTYPVIRKAFSHFLLRSSSTNTPPTHNSLATFLAHARSTSLSPTSTLYVGTYYEYLCLDTLPRLGFTSLLRTGGRSDAGIDLLGHWSLPSLSPVGNLHALIQCKGLKSKPQPSLIRELEGMLAGAPAGWRGPETVGVLCAKREATRGVREAVRRSGMPIVWVMVEDLGEGKGGRVRQVLWNSRVTDLGAEGMGVGVRYLPSGEGEVEREAVLTWKGKVWEGDGNGEPKEEG